MVRSAVILMYQFNVVHGDIVNRSKDSTDRVLVVLSWCFHDCCHGVVMTTLGDCEVGHMFV